MQRCPSVGRLYHELPLILGLFSTSCQRFYIAEEIIGLSTGNLSYFGPVRLCRPEWDNRAAQMDGHTSLRTVSGRQK